MLSEQSQCFLLNHKCNLIPSMDLHGNLNSNLENILLRWNSIIKLLRNYQSMNYPMK